MNYIIFLIIACIGIIADLKASSYPYNYDQQPSRTKCDPIKRNILPHRVYFAPDIYYRQYSEDITPPGKSDEYGAIYGLQVGYEYLNPSDLYINASLRGSYGDVLYDGALQHFETRAITPYQSRTNSAFFNAELIGGYTCQLTHSLFIPFIGFGYHMWDRGFMSTDPYGYEEIYSWNYIAYGFKRYAPLSPNWSWCLSIKFMQMFNSQMFTDNTIFNLGNCTQCEIETPFIYTPCKPFLGLDQIRLVPYVREQDIGRSNYQYIYIQSIDQFVSFVEPSSRTFLIGFRVEFSRKF